MAKGSRGGKRTGGGATTTTTTASTNNPYKPGSPAWGMYQAYNQQASASGGGSGSSMPAPQATQAAQPTQPQAAVQQVQPAKTMSANYNQFMSMNDDQKAAVITQNIGKGVPAHLSDSSYQKFIYNMGLNDKPDVVTEAQLKAMPGQDVFRTVNSIYDSKNDIGYTAPQICKQVTGGRVTRQSDNGGSAYGRGIYFATTRSSSTGYGNVRGNIQKTAVIHAKLNSNAKIINYSNAMRGAMNEMSSGSKLGKALSKCDRASQASIYALSKGYNVISDGMNDYMCVLNRNALTCSGQFTAK